MLEIGLQIKNIEVKGDGKTNYFILQKPFIANCIPEIQELVAPVQWEFCKGKQNPAYVLSRGCSALDFVNNLVWLNGPIWLKGISLPLFTHETLINLFDEKVLQEKHKTLVYSISQNSPEF